MRLHHEFGVEFVPFFATVESNFGFMLANFAGESFGRAATDVGRITHDQIEPHGVEGRKKVGLKKANTVCETETSGVAAGHIEGGGGDVRGVNDGAGKLFGQGGGDAAGAGTDIHEGEAFAGNTRRAAGAEFAEGETIECDLDEMLGFRARDQHVGRHFEFETPKLLFAGEVLRGLAVGAALNQSEILSRGISGENFFRMRIEPDAITGDDIEEEKLSGQGE